MTKVLPSPSAEVTVISPCNISAILFAMARPSPTPPPPSLQIAELQQYLPKALTLDEVRHIILEIIESGETNKGKIIKATVSEVGNRFERSKIPGLVEIALMGQL